MRIPSRRNLAVTGLMFALAAAFLIAWIWARRDQVSTPAELSMIRQDNGATVQSVSVTNRVPDFFQSKYPAAQRVEFHVSSGKPISIFALATGVEVRTESGWQPFSNEPRNEIWRLKPGTAQDMFVQVPEKGAEQTWRAYVLYAVEMHGPSLLEAQIREAWKIRSFTNWTGKAWGGGRFCGTYEFFSQEFSK